MSWWGPTGGLIAMMGRHLACRAWALLVLWVWRVDGESGWQSEGFLHGEMEQMRVFITVRDRKKLCTVGLKRA